MVDEQVWGLLANLCAIGFGYCIGRWHGSFGKRDGEFVISGKEAEKFYKDTGLGQEENVEVSNDHNKKLCGMARCGCKQLNNSGEKDD